MGHPGLHGFEKARDATTNFSILASQFHGCGHQQASAPTIGTARAVNVAGKVGPQAVDRLSAGGKFDIHPCQGIGNVAIKRTQEERVLVTESGVKAATRRVRRAKKVRERRGGRTICRTASARDITTDMREKRSAGVESAVKRLSVRQFEYRTERTGELRCTATSSAAC